MDTQFNLFEILQIAEAVESKAARFYRYAAEQCADDERRHLYNDLAHWRTEHEDAWRCIRHQYSQRTGESGTFDPNNYVLSNPWTMASLAGYGTNPNGRDRVTGHETREQILQEAIRRAQGIIIFYHGLKEFARGPDSHLMLDNIVSEEERHIRLLADTLEQMQPASDDVDTTTFATTCIPPRAQDHRARLAQN